MSPSTSTASSSRPLAGRQPLSTLPLSLFVGPSGSLPSPVSIPLKRASLPAEETGSASKVRRISLEARAEGGEDTARKRRTPTQREMDVMAKDDLGVGKSPARRLFGGTAASPSPRLSGRGVSGAIETAEAGPSSGPYTPSSPFESPLTPTLDAAPPITVIIENGVEISVHHPGFSLYRDLSPDRLATMLSTPKGKGKAIEVSSLAVDALVHLAPSPTSTPGSISRYNENQENIPPNPNLPTPTKGSDKGTPTKVKWIEDPLDSLTGSGRRRVLERSKLGTLLASQETEAEELRAGRPSRPRTRLAKSREAPRERMKREVDRI